VRSVGSTRSDSKSFQKPPFLHILKSSFSPTPIQSGVFFDFRRLNNGFLTEQDPAGTYSLPARIRTEAIEMQGTFPDGTISNLFGMPSSTLETIRTDGLEGR
jgi:hypothetical protein